MGQGSARGDSKTWLINSTVSSQMFSLQTLYSSHLARAVDGHRQRWLGLACPACEPLPLGLERRGSR